MNCYARICELCLLTCELQGRGGTGEAVHRTARRIRRTNGESSRMLMNRPFMELEKDTKNYVRARQATRLPPKRGVPNHDDLEHADPSDRAFPAPTTVSRTAPGTSGILRTSAGC